MWYTESEVIEMNPDISKYENFIWTEYFEPLNRRMKEEAKEDAAKNSDKPAAEILPDTEECFQKGPYRSKYRLPPGGLIPTFSFAPDEEKKKQFAHLYFPIITFDMSEKEMLNVALHRDISVYEAEIFQHLYPTWFI